MINTTHRLLISLIITAALSSCTLNEGDPKTTLCKKLTAHLMDKQDKQWGESSKTTLANNAMKININWENQDASGILAMNANCIYLADDNVDNEDYDMNSSDGYYTLPDSITINGKETDQKSLYIAIHKVTGQSIKDTASEEHLRKKVAEANETIREGTAALQTKAGEAATALKEGSEVLKQKAGEAAKTLQEGSEALKQKAGEAAQSLQENSKELKHKAGEAIQKTGEYLQKE